MSTTLSPRAAAFACAIDTYRPHFFANAEEEAKRAKYLHAQGYSIASIAFTLCCSASRIRAYLQD
jgi:hypothetical protein